MIFKKISIVLASLLLVAFGYHITQIDDSNQVAVTDQTDEWEWD